MAKKANSRSPLRASARSREKKASHEDAKTLRGDFSDDLPEGWAHLQLGDFVYIAARIGWRGLKASEYTETGPLFLSVHSLNKGEEVDFKAANHISLERYDESPEIKLEEGDILLAKDGAGIGKIGIVKHLPDAATVNSSLLVVRGRGAFVPKFLFYTLAGPKMQELVQSRITGSATPHLFQKDIKLFDLAVPPLPEQRRIVAKVEELLGRVNAARARLAKVPAILKRFRQSVLAAACSGELTGDWREGHDTSSVELALADSAKRVEAKAIKHLIRRGTQGLAEPEIPPIQKSWVSRTVRQLVEAGAILDFQDGNHGSLYPRAADFGESGVKFLTATQVFDNRVLLEEAPLLKHDKAKLLRIGFTQPGDVLLTHNATVGRVAILPRYEGDVILGTSVTYYRVNPRVILPRYLCLFMQGHFWQDQLRSVMEQTTRNQVSVTKQVEFVVLLPPVEEQDEIVRRVDALFALADKIESRVAAATARVEKITQAVLAKAFRGELVPTEAELARQERRDYEPASVLLERIRTEREAADNDKPRRKSPRRKAKKVPKRK